MASEVTMFEEVWQLPGRQRGVLMSEPVVVKVVALAIIDADGKWHSVVAGGWMEPVSFIGVRDSNGKLWHYAGEAYDVESWAKDIPGIRFGEKGVNMDVFTYNKGD